MSTPRVFAVFGLVFLAAGVAGCGGGVREALGGSPESTSMSPSEAAFANEVFTLVNEVRLNAGLPPVRWHAAASDVAHAHCLDMQLRGYVDGIDPEGLGPSDRLQAAGIAYGSYGENVAAGFGTPQAFMDAWMADSEKVVDILSPECTHLGVGVSGLAAPGGAWCTQLFLRPL